MAHARPVTYICVLFGVAVRYDEWTASDAISGGSDSAASPPHSYALVSVMKEGRKEGGGPMEGDSLGAAGIVPPHATTRATACWLRRRKEITAVENDTGASANTLLI